MFVSNDGQSRSLDSWRTKRKCKTVYFLLRRMRIVIEGVFTNFKNKLIDNSFYSTNKRFYIHENFVS